jgi:hypothetical protein
MVLSHELPLSQDWSIWRFVALRSAGFPLESVDGLASPEAGSAYDEVLELETIVEREREAALARLGQLLETADEEQRKALRKLLKRVRAGNFVADDARELAAIEQLRAAAIKAEQAHARARTIFEEAERRCAAAVARELRSPLMFEALIWQNRAAARTFESHLGEGASIRSADRRYTRQGATYIQRYTTKNDSVGFFGPVAWTEVADGRPNIAVTHGPRLTRRLTTYFEHWAIAAVASALSSDPRLLPWITARRSPSVDPAEFAALEAAIVERADGEHRVSDIARELGEATASSQADTLRAIEGLVSRGALILGIEVPLGYGGKRPETALHDAIARVDDLQLRAELTAKLEPLDRARDAISTADGTAALDRALEEADAVFSELSGVGASRAPGEQYAGRSIVYPDAVRDVDLALGAGLLAKVRPALDLVLTGYRWFAYEVAAAYRQRMDAIFDGLGSAADARGEVAYAAYWDALRPISALEPRLALPAFVKDVATHYTERWSRVLDVDPGERERRYSTDEIASAVRAAFDAPHAGAPFCAYCAPDLMIAAESVEAINRGDYQVVVGEIHGAGTPLLNSWILLERDHPEELMAAFQAESRHRHVRFVVPSGAPLARLFPKHTPGALFVEHDSARANAPRSDVVGTGELRIRREGNALVVHRPSTRETWDAVHFHESILQNAILRSFKGIVRAGAHFPRITFDDLVVAREQWEFATEDIAFAKVVDGSERFLSARRFRAQHGLPRQCFAKFAEERKPYYVDFDSPVLIEVFAATARKCSQVTVSEMLPSPSQCWLMDRDGRRYTCELRTMMRDARAWSAG